MTYRLDFKAQKALHHDTLGDRLRALRQARNLTQKELGELSYTNQAVIQKIENHKSLRPLMLKQIAEALRVPPVFLAYGIPETVAAVKALHRHIDML